MSISDGRLSLIGYKRRLTYLENNALRGAIIIDDKIAVNVETGCVLATGYIAEYFRESVV